MEQARAGFPGREGRGRVAVLLPGIQFVVEAVTFVHVAGRLLDVIVVVVVVADARRQLAVDGVLLDVVAKPRDDVTVGRVVLERKVLSFGDGRFYLRDDARKFGIYLIADFCKKKIINNSSFFVSAFLSF